METQGFTFRPMRDADATGMHDVHTRAVRQVCARMVEPHTVEAWLHGRTPKGYLRAADEGGEAFWIAVSDNGEIAGFASWREDELVSLFVDPERERRGLGHRLFATCEEDASKNGHKIVRLISTLNAQTFYESLGFTAEGEGHTEKRGVRIPHIEMRRI